ncbi:AMP-binding protein [Rheinheimera maricola]|uniref:AMP-binding protein n=1 Tax=Rheinheimera maricola TaxID=2793282 RepID=A0ABS7X467_9GAMM|nr:AMP-binding protein [Rheinheimera maricola]MBZ9610343.1 AMP-binding protein [Rheinheimera maricola]
MLENAVTKRHSCNLFRDALRWQAQCNPKKPALSFVKNRHCETTMYTFSEVYDLAMLVASQLIDYHSCGKKIGIPAANNIEFVAGLLGCLFVGAIAVPLPLELQGVSNARGNFILRDADLDVIINLKNDDAWVECGIPVVNIKMADDCSISFAQLPAISPCDTAIIQFTSGTSGEPTGVGISHQAISTNLLIIEEAFGHLDKKKRVALNWCPFYHDMGLIGGLLEPLFTGLTIVQLNPIDFLKRPLLWLTCIDKFRVTTCGGPTFGYQLVNSALRNLPSVDYQFDLSCWDAAFCGAEPVNVAILEEFAQRLSHWNFNSKALLPCYGMAEFTLFVTGSPFLSGMKVKEILLNGQINKIVSCGRPYADTKIKIADEQGVDVGENVIGQIHLSGGSLLSAYWRHGSQSQILDEYGFLATGDLGFLSQGELYLTGRSKQLIKINGVGLFPHLVLDEIARTIPELDALKGLILQPDINCSKLFIFHELKRGVKIDIETTDLVTERAKRIAVQLTGSGDIEFFIVKAGFLPKTSSGKLIAQNSDSFVKRLLGRIHMPEVSALA